MIVFYSLTIPLKTLIIRMCIQFAVDSKKICFLDSFIVNQLDSLLILTGFFIL